MSSPKITFSIKDMITPFINMRNKQERIKMKMIEKLWTWQQLNLVQLAIKAGYLNRVVLQINPQGNQFTINDVYMEFISIGYDLIDNIKDNWLRLVQILNHYSGQWPFKTLKIDSYNGAKYLNYEFEYTLNDNEKILVNEMISFTDFSHDDLNHRNLQIVEKFQKICYMILRNIKPNELNKSLFIGTEFFKTFDTRNYIINDIHDNINIMENDWFGKITPTTYKYYVKRTIPILKYINNKIYMKDSETNELKEVDMWRLKTRISLDAFTPYKLPRYYSNDTDAFVDVLDINTNTMNESRHEQEQSTFEKQSNTIQINQFNDTIAHLENTITSMNLSNVENTNIPKVKMEEEQFEAINIEFPMPLTSKSLNHVTNCNEINLVPHEVIIIDDDDDYDERQMSTIDTEDNDNISDINNTNISNDNDEHETTIDDIQNTIDTGKNDTSETTITMMNENENSRQTSQLDQIDHQLSKVMKSTKVSRRNKFKEIHSLCSERDFNNQFAHTSNFRELMKDQLERKKQNGEITIPTTMDSNAIIIERNENDTDDTFKERYYLEYLKLKEFQFQYYMKNSNITIKTMKKDDIIQEVAFYLKAYD